MFEDGIVNSRTIYSYDADGNMLNKEFDYADDGTVDKFWAWTFDCWE